MCRQDSVAEQGRRASHSKAPAAGGDEIGLGPGWTPPALHCPLSERLPFLIRSVPHCEKVEILSAEVSLSDGRETS